MKLTIQSLWRQLWPHLAVLAVFLLISVIYFAPGVFQGKSLQQGDVVSYMGWGQDARQYHEQTGDYAWWSNRMFGGMPHNYTFSPASNNLFRYVAEVAKAGLSGAHAGLLWLYLIGFYVFMLSMGCGPWLSGAGAIAFALASYNIVIIDAGHLAKCMTIATLPAVLAGVMQAYRGKYVAGSLIVFFALGLNIYWNHQQISYYLILMLALLAVTYFVFALRERKVGRFFAVSLLLVCVAVLAVLPAADKLIPTMDYSRESMRGGAVLHSDEAEDTTGKAGLERDYAFQWSYGKAETMTLLIPGYYGNSSHAPLGENSETYNTVKRYAGAQQARRFIQTVPAYWGTQPFTSGPVYAGAIVCMLFLLGLFLVRGPERWWLCAAAVLGVLMSWGRNLPGLNNFLFDYLPLYNKFRTPSMALVMTTTAMAMLGLLGLREAFDRNRDTKAVNRALAVAAGITGLLCLLFALFPGLAGDFRGASDAQLPDWLRDALVADRRSLLVADAWRSLGFIAAAAALIWCYRRFSGFRPLWAVAIMALLFVADLWPVDKRFLNDSHFVKAKAVDQIVPTEADKQILSDTDPGYRVLNLTTSTFNESHTSYFHQTLGGYSPAKLRRYQDVIDLYLSRQLNMNVLDMLNTRYVIVPDRQGGRRVQRNAGAMGNAWFVERVEWVNSPDEEIAAIGDGDLRHIAYVDTVWRTRLPEAPVMTAAAAATVRLTDCANPGDLFYETDAPEDGLIVFSEIYYKTWQAFVDGQEMPLVRADYLLRALKVPAGRHTVELRCTDNLFIRMHRLSLIVSILLCAILLTLCGWGILRKVKSRK